MERANDAGEETEKLPRSGEGSMASRQDSRDIAIEC